MSVITPVSKKNAQNIDELKCKYTEAYNRSDHLTLNRLEGQLVEMAQKSYGKDKEANKQLTTLEKVARSGNRRELMRLLPTIKKSMCFREDLKEETPTREDNEMGQEELLAAASNAARTEWNRLTPNQRVDLLLDFIVIAHSRDAEDIKELEWDKLPEDIQHPLVSEFVGIIVEEAEGKRPRENEDLFNIQEEVRQAFPEEARYRRFDRAEKDEGSMTSTTPGVWNPVHGGREKEPPKPKIKITPVKKETNRFVDTGDTGQVNDLCFQFIDDNPKEVLRYLADKHLEVPTKKEARGVGVSSSVVQALVDYMVERSREAREESQDEGDRAYYENEQQKIPGELGGLRSASDVAEYFVEQGYDARQFRGIVAEIATRPGVSTQDVVLLMEEGEHGKHGWGT